MSVPPPQKSERRSRKVYNRDMADNKTYDEQLAEVNREWSEFYNAWNKLTTIIIDELKKSRVGKFIAWLYGLKKG